MTSTLVCGSCGSAHPVETEPSYCSRCHNNYDSGCMNEIAGSPVCFQCTPKDWRPS